MKTIVAILSLLIMTSVKSQTTVYTVNKDGTKDLSHFYYFDHSTGKVYECYSCKDPSEKKRKPDFTIKIEGDKIVRVMDATEERIVNGRLREDKKVIQIKRGEEGYDGSAPTVKDKKVFDVEGNLIGIIEGKEIYGAAAYLIGLFR